MSDLTDLYQELLLDHSKHPYHHHALEDADHAATGHNPLCGDRLTVYLKTVDEQLAEVTFTSQACAICTASASLMTHRVRGMQRDNTERLIDQMHGLLTGETDIDPQQLDELGALEGVKRYPMRVKCATLPWHTLRAALKGSDETSTE